MDGAGEREYGRLREGLTDRGVDVERLIAAQESGCQRRVTKERRESAPAGWGR